jgi:hypothetical protein
MRSMTPTDGAFPAPSCLSTTYQPRSLTRRRQGGDAGDSPRCRSPGPRRLRDPGRRGRSGGGGDGEALPEAVSHVASVETIEPERVTPD